MAIQNVETKPPETSSEELIINELPSKTTPVDSDIIVLEDSSDSFSKKKLTWADLKAILEISIGGMTAVSTPNSFTGETFFNYYFDYDVADLSFTDCIFRGICYIKNVGGTITHTNSKGGLIFTNGDIVPDVKGFFEMDPSKF